ncbi:MAG: DUF3800 domain-containing protein [Alphaproteobacteria bacterium]|nr:DUF3800 domain-containing protein [Alphaproteobacteria bacterium]
MNLATEVGQHCHAILADSNGQVGVFRGYLDESGIHEGARVVSVAGYFARPKEWKRFTHDWTRVLKPAGIKCFHATDCQALEGEFKGWSADDRDELVKRLLPIIPRYAVGFARALVLDDFHEALEGRNDLKEIIEDPYKLCFQLLLQEALRQLQRNNSREKIAVFHEQNDYQGSAQRSYDFLKEHHDPNDNFLSLTFGDAMRFVPLQAADILAFESGKRVLNKRGRKRRSYQALCEGANGVQIGFFDHGNMDRFVRVLENFKHFRDAALSRGPLS